jgi:iron(III) transport system permease protein
LIASRGDLNSISHLFHSVLGAYIWNSVLLCVGSVLGALALGIGSAWLTARYDFWGKKMLTPLLVLPLAMPVYVVAYVYADALQYSGPVQSFLRATFAWSKGDYWFPDMRSLLGACAMFACVLYPYVYLLCKDAFVAHGARYIDVARSLGMHRHKAFWHVALPSARPAWVAGAALVMMECLADYGAVSYLGVDTFSVGIFRTWFGLADKAGAAQLSICLLVFVAWTVHLEHHSRDLAQYSAYTAAQARIRLSGLKSLAAAWLCALPILLGFVLPVLLLCRLWWQDSDSQWQSPHTLALWHSLWVALLCIAVCVGLAVLFALYLRQHPTSPSKYAQQLLAMGYAAPGAVLAIAILWVMSVFEESLGRWSATLLFTGSVFALIYAYTIRFFAIAAGSIDSGLARISKSIDDAANSLGVRGLAACRRIHLPLLKPSMLSAALLVFIDCLKELPATLSLRPFNFNTLATQIHQFTRDERLAEAALPSLLLVGLCTIALLYYYRLSEPGSVSGDT